MDLEAAAVAAGHKDSKQILLDHLVGVERAVVVM
jgi:hypothetical protein